MIAKIMKKEIYPAKVYSYFGLKKLITKYFKDVKFYIPLPHYQYVYDFAEIDNYEEIIEKAKKLLKNKNLALDSIQVKTLKLIIQLAKLKMTKLFAPTFIVIAKNKKEF